MTALDDIKKHSPKADADVVAAMERTYRLALTHVDARLVSFSDPDELKRVRTNFVQKKLGVTDSPEAIDAKIAEVGKRISGQKQRLTLYYLLAEEYGKLDVFTA